MSATITGYGLAVPEGRLTNADLEARVDTNDAWIVERTGIRERRIAGPDETTASLGALAGAIAIKDAGLQPADIDLLIVATATPEQPIPHTGAFVGETLGLRCGSFDLGAGCAGFVYGLVAAAGMVAAGTRNVLLIGAETLSRVVDPEDRGTCVLFGDGAGAAVLAATDRRGILAWDLGCDGSAAHLLEIPAGGSRRPTTIDTIAARDHYLKMAGQEVFRRAVRAVVDSARLTLERAGMEPSDVNWFVPHQANARIIEAAANRLGIPSERTLVNIDRYGNTSSASIPLALFEAVADGRVREGDIVLASGFGAGMTWASALLEWGRQ
ncbi:MAG: 3-oxoacyl-[acyl-carrier-protein] synthase 3 [Actinomycetia bacterium]|nr:3-oxoacyl-[acyl-carrier-protein] synthase 3 [Actinomycetes bacterium]